MDNDQQTIFRITRRENPFVQIDRAVLEDDRLSWKAKGVLCYLLSRPNDWKVMLADLAGRSTDGITSVRSALQELRRLGYAKLKVVRASGGELGGKVWTIYEIPNRADIQETLMSATDIQVSTTSVNPNFGQSDPTNKDSNKEGSETKKEGRPRNLHFDALCEVEGSNPNEINGHGGEVAKALRSIRTVSPDATPDEIRRRARNYRALWPHATLTASALAKHWAKFGADTLPGLALQPGGRAPAVPLMR